MIDVLQDIVIMAKIFLNNQLWNIIKEINKLNKKLKWMKSYFEYRNNFIKVKRRIYKSDKILSGILHNTWLICILGTWKALLIQWGNSLSGKRVSFHIHMCEKIILSLFSHGQQNSIKFDLSCRNHNTLAITYFFLA